MNSDKIDRKLTMEEVLLHFIRLADPTEIIRLKYNCDQELFQRSASRMKESRRKRFGPREVDDDVIKGNVTLIHGTPQTEGKSTFMNEDADGNVKKEGDE